MTFDDGLTMALIAALLIAAAFQSIEGACAALILFAAIHLMRMM